MFTRNSHHGTRSQRLRAALPHIGRAFSLPFHTAKLLTDGMSLNKFEANLKSVENEMEESYLYSISMCGG